MGIHIPNLFCMRHTTYPYQEMDMRFGVNTFANNPNLGTYKMEKEQQANELRMDWSIGIYHRYLGLLAILCRS